MTTTTPARPRAGVRPRPVGDRTPEQVERIRKIQRTGAYLLLVLCSAAFLMPLLWMLTTSLKDARSVLEFPPRFIPEEFHWENYWNAWNSTSFTRFLGNSVLLTALQVIGSLVSCILPAYAFARLRSRWRGPMFAAMLATMMIPGQVTLVPKFLLFSKLDMVDTYWPIVLPSFFGTALYIFLLRQFFTTIPQELVDSARIDGAGELRILWQVMIPLSKPAIATVTLMALVPVIVVFLAAQKHFIRGITLTGISGR